ncbi:MAG: hypothetical protein JWO99_387 [Candidatus Saccharibacteria bacterium]|nr:hypothetical protein [Candidatus Saccharibacteria bacterium]
MPENQNEFNTKGTAAEELIAELCGNAFFRDFHTSSLSSIMNS